MTIIEAIEAEQLRDNIPDFKAICGEYDITPISFYFHLGDREKEILILRFYDSRTQMDVAKLLNISQAQVSRLEKGAITALRRYVSVPAG